MLKVIVCGTRYGYVGDYFDIFSRLSKLPIPSLIIHGGATGIDSLADTVAKELGHHTVRFDANWNKFGREAGPIRNRLMADIMNPNLVIAFHTDPDLGKGTKHMVNYAKSKNICIETIIKEDH